MTSENITPLTLTPNSHIHFIGIGGIGMSGIAEILARRGFQVSGSDVCQNALTKNLVDLGVKITQGHDGKHINSADMVVTSTAISAHNPEMIAAQQAGIQIVKRAQMLAFLMTHQHAINIAGTHGKTTTSSLIASVLNDCGLDPSFVVGGWLHQFRSNAKLGTGKYFVAEADESDASFLYLPSNITIVTNIGADHLETYQGDFDKLKQTFINFLGRLPETGLAVVCIDDPVLRELLPHIKRPIVTYGFSIDADIQARDFDQQGLISHFSVQLPDETQTLNVTLPMPGKHNALNALATLATGLALDLKAADLIHALSQFHGVGRRFQVYGKLPIPGGEIELIDDYGHHPDEVAATIRAARAAYPNQRLVMVFQPHRYTRTQALFDEFVSVLARVDQLVLLDIYAASEAPIVGITGKRLADAIANAGGQVVFCPDIDKLLQTLTTLLQDGDKLLTQGAGSIGQFVRFLDKHHQAFVDNRND